MPATIIAYTESTCPQCGMGKSIDQIKTSKNASLFIDTIEKKKVSGEMKISPQYLGDLLAGRRPWNAELAEKFEAAVTELKK